jgi:hypothetical protein
MFGIFPEYNLKLVPLCHGRNWTTKESVKRAQSFENQTGPLNSEVRVLRLEFCVQCTDQHSGC